MAIEFDLELLHPSFYRWVVDIFSQLDADYPVGMLRRVHVYKKDDDLSIAGADKPGEIALNAFWFGRPVDVFRAAARNRPIIHVGDTTLYWHGNMEEPQHVLSHEFAHCLQDALPWWREFTTTHWRAACADPMLCRPVSGYALSGPDEWGADTFAALYCRIDCEATRLLGAQLAAWMTGSA